MQLQLSCCREPQHTSDTAQHTKQKQQHPTKQKATDQSVLSFQELSHQLQLLLQE
jgi:hypothetical protein